MFFKKSVVLLGVVVALGNCQFAAAADKLSFAKAWADVLGSNQELQAKRSGMAAQQQMVSARQRLYYPDLSLSANYIRLQNDVATPKLHSSNPQAAGMLGSIQMPEYLAQRDITQAHLRATMPLYVGGRVTNAKALASAQLNEQRAELDNSQRQLFATLAQRYFGVDLAAAVLSTRQLAQAALCKHFAHAQLLERQGQIAKVESLQAQTACDSAQLETQKAQQNLQIAKLGLANISRQSDANWHQVDDLQLSDDLFVNAELPALASLLEQLADNPMFALLQAKRQQAQLAAKLAAASRLPSVLGFADYSLHSKGLLHTDDKPDWLVGIGIKIPLFDRNAGGIQADAHRHSVAKVDALIAKAKTDMQLLLRANYQQAQQALTEYHSLNSSIELGTTALDMREKAFAQGLSSSLEVVDAQLYLSSVQTKRSQAAYNYVVALAQLLALTGNTDKFAAYQFKYGVKVS